MIAHLTERALHVLGLDATTPVEPRVPLKEMGLDSLDGGGVAQQFGPFGRPIVYRPRCCSTTRLSMRSQTYLARAWRLEADAADATGAAIATSAKSVNAIAELSDNEAEALLLEELELSTVGRRA